MERLRAPTPQRSANQATALLPGILRLWRLFAIGPIPTDIFQRSRSTYVPIFTISRNAGSANGITDKRDWRTSGMPLSLEWLLISRSVTGLAQWFDGSQINSGPVAFLGSRILICRPNYFGDPDNSFVLAAMIEKDFIILLHSAQVVARCVIAHTSPTGLALRDKVRPRI